MGKKYIWADDEDEELFTYTLLVSLQSTPDYWKQNITGTAGKGTQGCRICQCCHQVDEKDTSLPGSANPAMWLYVSLWTETALQSGIDKKQQQQNGAPLYIVCI